MRSAKDYADALTEARGMVSVAARRLGVTRRAVYNALEKFPSVADALRDAREATTDMAELKLLEAIKDREPWAVALYLKTQGKDRGYTERLDIKVDQEVQRELEQLLTDLRSSLSQDAYAEIAAYLSSRVGEGAGSERQPN